MFVGVRPAVLVPPPPPPPPELRGALDAIVGLEVPPPPRSADISAGPAGVPLCIIPPIVGPPRRPEMALSGPATGTPIMAALTAYDGMLLAMFSAFAAAQPLGSLRNEGDCVAVVELAIGATLVGAAATVLCAGALGADAIALGADGVANCRSFNTGDEICAQNSGLKPATRLGAAGVVGACGASGAAATVGEAAGPNGLVVKARLVGEAQLGAAATGLCIVAAKTAVGMLDFKDSNAL